MAIYYSILAVLIIFYESLLLIIVIYLKNLLNTVTIMKLHSYAHGSIISLNLIVYFNDYTLTNDRQT